MTDAEPPADLAALHQRASAPTPGVLETLAGHDGDILVLGAGGKMGFHLCLMLRKALEKLSRSTQVIAVSRFSDPTQRAAFEEAGIPTVPCDLRDASQLAALPDAPTLFFLAGVKFGTAGAPGLLEEFNVTMPRCVAHRFAGSRIVALSTGCVYPFVPPASGGCSEDTPPDPPGRYALSCLGRENAFRELSKERGTPVTLVRLNYSVDLRYGVLVDIAENVMHGRAIDVSTGFVNVIWQGDALAHIIQSLSLAASPPSVINITGSQILEVRKVAETLGKLLGREVTFVGEESPTAWLSNASRAHRLFGRPAVTEDTLVRWVAHWVANGGETLGKPTRFEVRNGRF